MKKSTFNFSLVLLFMVLVITIPAQAKEESINNILVNPVPFWNMQVTLIGEVQNVTANPAGTTRGTYTLLDDSSTNTITIRTRALPSVGRTYSVTGIVLQDPNNANIPEIKELERVDDGEFSASTRNLLIGLGVLLLILIIIFVVLLLKPKKTAARQSGSATVIKPEAIPTIAVPMPAAQGGETQLLQNPIAELLVEQGSDKDMMFTISENTSTIGRSGTRLNDVVLTDNTVSKKQALLQFDPVSNHFSIVNESAKNQTKVNGIITDKPVFLKDGDLIEMGKTALRFKIRSALH